MNTRNRKKLFASATMVVASLALLVGLTFAWFTDSVKSTGNKIQAGTLDISATVASVDTSKTDFDINGKKFGFGEATNVNESSPIISEKQWEPGQSNAKLITVTNKGNLAAKVKLQFDVAENSELQDALWFDFVQVKNGQATGQFQKKSFAEIQTQAGSLELPLAPANENNDTDSVSFIMLYGMNEEAGNDYQGKSFTADVTILAKQDTVEKDGFGSDQYDKDAAYPQVKTVSTADDLKNALTSNTGSPVNVTLEQPFGSISNRINELNVTGDVTLMVPAFNNKEGFYAGDLTVAEGGSLTINGEWKSGGSTSTVDVNNTVTVTGAGSTLTLNNICSTGQSGAEKTGFAATDGGTLTINGGYYSTSGYQGVCVLADGGTVVITGGHFGAAGADSNAFVARNGGKIIIAKSVYENTRINGDKIPNTCVATLVGDNYEITQK